MRFRDIHVVFRNVTKNLLKAFFYAFFVLTLLFACVWYFSKLHVNNTTQSFQIKLGNHEYSFKVAPINRLEQKDDYDLLMEKQAKLEAYYDSLPDVVIERPWQKPVSPPVVYSFITDTDSDTTESLKDRFKKLTQQAHELQIAPVAEPNTFAAIDENISSVSKPTDKLFYCGRIIDNVYNDASSFDLFDCRDVVNDAKATFTKIINETFVNLTNFTHHWIKILVVLLTCAPTLHYISKSLQPILKMMQKKHVRNKLLNRLKNTSTNFNKAITEKLREPKVSFETITFHVTPLLQKVRNSDVSFKTVLFHAIIMLQKLFRCAICGIMIGLLLEIQANADAEWYYINFSKAIALKPLCQSFVRDECFSDFASRYIWHVLVLFLMNVINYDFYTNIKAQKYALTSFFGKFRYAKIICQTMYFFGMSMICSAIRIWLDDAVQRYNPIILKYKNVNSNLNSNVEDSYMWHAYTLGILFQSIAVTLITWHGIKTYLSR